VFINHRLLSDVGRVVRAWEDEHWIRAELELDPCKVPLRVLANPAGVAVSVGLDARTVGSGDDEIVTSAKLEEVSIVPNGNGLHRGARIEQLVATAGASALTSGAGPPTWRDDTGKKLRRTSGRVIRVT
jgi:hypothetical protein